MGDASAGPMAGLSEMTSAAAALQAVTRALAGPREVDGVLTESELRRLYAERVVTLHGGNKSRAARALGMSRSGLYRVLKGEG